MKNKLYNIELINDATTNIIEKILLKSNILELPTKELIMFILNVCVVFEINNIMEFCSRTGILSELLKKYSNDYDITSYNDQFVDNNDSCKTIFSSVLNINDYTTQKSMFTPSCLIINWPDKIIERQIINYLSNDYKKISIIIVIGDIFNRTITPSFVNKMSTLGYNNYSYNVKQVSWIDYFYNNKKKCINNRIILFYLKSRNIDINALNNIFDTNIFHSSSPSSILQSTSLNEDIDDILCDVVFQKKMPNWILNSDNKNNVIKIYKKICEYKYLYLTIPLWIKNMNELVFWYTSLKNRMLPHIFINEYENKNLNISNLFNEYYELMTNLHDKGLLYYKKENNIAEFINNIRDAEKYIYLLFSTINDYEWRNNNKIDDFINKFNEIYEKHKILFDLYN